MSNLQQAFDLEITVVVSAHRLDESLFTSRTDSPEMVCDVYTDLIKQR
jgi:hypothetical protein